MTMAPSRRREVCLKFRAGARRERKSEGSGSQGTMSTQMLINMKMHCFSKASEKGINNRFKERGYRMLMCDTDLRCFAVKRQRLGSLDLLVHSILHACSGDEQEPAKL